jgi:hypothetical protein
MVDMETWNYYNKFKEEDMKNNTNEADGVITKPEERLDDMKKELEIITNHIDKKSGFTRNNKYGANVANNNVARAMVSYDYKDHIVIIDVFTHDDINDVRTQIL